jgi:PAS domain S-box-containing protein
LLILTLVGGAVLLILLERHKSPTGKDPLTLAERHWLVDNAENLRLALEPYWPPLSFTDFQGEERGIVAEHIQLLEQRLGVKFKRVQYGSWSELLKAAYQGEVDIIPAAQQTPERSRHLLFTRPYLSFATAIITDRKVKRKLTLSQMKGMAICVQRDSALHQEIAQLHPDFTLIPVKDPLSGLLKVSFGEADALVINQAPIAYLIEYHGLANLQIAGHLDFRYDFRIASPKKLPILNRILEKGLAQITPEERQRIVDNWISAREEYFYHRKKFWVSILAAALLSVVAIVTILLWNLSLRQRVARQTAELQRSEFKLRAIFDQSFQLIALLKTNGKVIDTNRTTLEMFDITEADVIGNFLWDNPWLQKSATEVSKVKSAVKNAACGQVQRFELIRPNSQNDTMVVDVSLKPAKDNEGRILFLIAEGRDITERKRAEEARLKLETQTQQARKFKSLTVMAGSIAHNFNNQLQAVLGNLELALHTLPPNSPCKRNLEAADHGAKRASQLSNLMLTYVGQGRMNLQQLCLADIVRETTDLLQESLPPGGILKVVFPSETTLFQGDPTMLRQVLNNLVSNAAESLPSGQGEITLSCGLTFCHQESFPPLFQNDKLPEGHYVFLEVKDSGCGMDEETLSKVFDPFFTTKFTGRGLGMATVLGIMRAHRGAISISSRPNQGTTVRVLFPATGSKEPA